MVKRFKCLLCGETCCTFRSFEDTPLVFPWEKRILEEKASEKRLKLVFKPYVVYMTSSDTGVVVLYKWIINGKCPFLDEKGLCSIHRDKPLACKMYPLIIGWDDNTLRVSSECPWIRDNLEYIMRNDPSKIFPEEFKHAVQVLAILKQVEEYARRRNWERRINPDSMGIHLIDIDEIFNPS